MPGWAGKAPLQCRNLGHQWVVSDFNATGEVFCGRCHVQRQQIHACGSCTAEFLSPKALGDHQRAMGHHREVPPTTVGMDEQDCEEIAAETVADLAALLKELECPPNR